jgi:hypothetical protein
MSARRLLALLALAATLAPPLLAGQGAPTGAITGRVVDADGEPIAKVVVVVGRLANGLEIVEQRAAEPDGTFRFEGLRRGLYFVFAARQRSGVLDCELVGGSADPYCKVGDDVTLRQRVGGVITGTVTTETGEPVVGVTVRATPTDRGSNLLPLPRSDVVWGRTDDRGIYRMWDVSPGRYLVAAGCYESENIAPDGGMFDRYPIVYHPGSSKAGAVEVPVAGGAEASAIDIRYAPKSGYTISGSIAMAAGSALVTITELSTGSIVDTTYVEKEAAGGSAPFSFNGVASGDYEVATVAELAVGGTVSGRRRVAVRGADVAGLTLAVAPLRFGSIAGRLVVEPTADLPAACAPRAKAAVEEMLLSAARDDPERGTRELEPGDLAVVRVAPDASGAFRFERLATARYWLDAPLPNATWYVRAVTLEQSGRPAVDLSASGVAVAAGANVTGIRISVAAGAASVRGRVLRSGEGSQVADVVVHLVPAEPEHAGDVVRYREVVAEGGAFAIPNVAPGRYRLLARTIPHVRGEQRLVRRAAWDAPEREKLRSEAEARGRALELAPCQRVDGVDLRY